MKRCGLPAADTLLHEIARIKRIAKKTKGGIASADFRDARPFKAGVDALAD